MSSSLLRISTLVVRKVVNPPAARAVLRPNTQLRCITSATPVSRKRLNALRAAEENEAPELDFKKLANEFFDQVQKAVEPMIQKNEYFVVTRTDRELLIDLGEGKGTYTFSTDDEVSTVTLLSPMSGGQQYRYDTETKQWVSISDDHDVRGLLTRDLIRQCVGYPEFP